MAFPVVRVFVAVGGLVRGQRLLLLFDACAITCGRSFTVLAVWVDHRQTTLCVRLYEENI